MTDLHDHIGDWIDPLVSTGLAVMAMNALRDAGMIRLFAGAILVSALWGWWIAHQPVRRGTDWTIDRAMEFIETRTLNEQ